MGTSSDAHYRNDVQSAVDLFNKFIDLVNIFQTMSGTRDEITVKLMKNQEEAENLFKEKVVAYISSPSFSETGTG